MFEHLKSFFEPGLIYGIGTLGLALVFRYLRFPDFTVLGSITTGGIATIWATNHTNLAVGLCVGVLVGGALGGTTGILVSGLNIRPVLASIITYTAAFSLGYLMTEGGTVSFPPNAPNRLLSPTYSPDDVAILAAIACAACIILAVAMKTKSGVGCHRL